MKNNFYKICSICSLFIVFFMVISCANDAETKYMIVQVPAEEQEKTYSVNVLNNKFAKRLFRELPEFILRKALKIFRM